MTQGQIPGATVAGREPLTPDAFDQAFEHTAHDLMWELSARAYGDDYPREVEPFGATTWWTLGNFVAAIRLGPGAHLVDLACGRGGTGLWLARATGARLTGVDWSGSAVRIAAERAPRFVPADRASFVVGDLAATGLDAESADGVVCTDAVFFAIDRIAVFAEAARILRRGGRFAFTADESADGRATAVPDWAPLIEAGGLIVENRLEIPRFSEQLRAMYDEWVANIDEIRAVAGNEMAQELIDEANAVGPTLAARTGVFYVARKPPA